MNIVLIGMSGSGKTSIGERLSKLLFMELLDTDQEIRELTAMEIDEIFSRFGQEHFRDLESQLLRKQVFKTNTVFATGGGIILRQENRQLLSSLGPVIFLKASPETLIRNLKSSKEVRPLLKDEENLKKDLEAMLGLRKEIYQEAGDYEINIDGLGLEEVVKEILEIKNLVQN